MFYFKLEILQTFHKLTLHFCKTSQNISFGPLVAGHSIGPKSWPLDVKCVSNKRSCELLTWQWWTRGSCRIQRRGHRSWLLDRCGLRRHRGRVEGWGGRKGRGSLRRKCSRWCYDLGRGGQEDSFRVFKQIVLMDKLPASIPMFLFPVSF